MNHCAFGKFEQQVDYLLLSPFTYYTVHTGNPFHYRISQWRNPVVQGLRPSSKILLLQVISLFLFQSSFSFLFILIIFFWYIIFRANIIIISSTIIVYTIIRFIIIISIISKSSILFNKSFCTLFTLSVFLLIPFQLVLLYQLI